MGRTLTIDDGAASERDRADVLAWFAQYDDLVGRGDLDAMADRAVFPINEVTDDAEGHALIKDCDRATFLTQMEQVVGDGGGVEMTSTRHPVFLAPGLCFVVTDAEFTVDGRTTTMRYGDLLVRTAEGWRFQTMVAGGWHAQM